MTKLARQRAQPRAARAARAVASTRARPGARNEPPARSPRPPTPTTSNPLQGTEQLVELAADRRGGAGRKRDPVLAVTGLAGEQVPAGGGVVNAHDMVGTLTFLEPPGARGT